MPAKKQLLIAAMTACVAAGWGQPNVREPHVGYLYPGGGRQGSVTEITVGGQFLRSADKAHVSGEGVRARVIKYYRPIRNLQKEQREELLERLRAVRDKRLAELPEKARAFFLFPGERPLRQGANKPRPKAAADKSKATPQPNAPGKSGAAKKDDAAKKAPFRPVEHPLLDDLESKSLRELRHLAYYIFFPRQMKQMNVQIDELVKMEITIDPDAAPGDRELRLQTPTGMTNPMVFQVGQFPEVSEIEPNDPVGRVGPVGQVGPVGRVRPVGQAAPYVGGSKAAPLDLPVLLNGQIMPGDVDRFRIRAKKGQSLVMEVHARRLVPFLADAVPGWFQATIALYDAEGKEVAFADDYRFNPDPVLFYRIPEDGEYELEIHDALYRGREDFVYRIAVGVQPFITAIFPLGGRTGEKTVASIAGWNLTGKQLPLDTEPGADGIRQTALREHNYISNEVVYAVDSLPECEEAEPNDTAKNAQRIDLPRIVNGRIARPGDVDVFQFEGRAGDQLVAEVYGRRLYSPLDSLLRLTDASGRVLEWNDDHMDKEGHLHRDMGFLTHHADSYLMARLPKAGHYCVHLTDSQDHGGEAYGYRLRLTPPRPDFALRVTPSSINLRAGRAAPLCVYVLRKDGFDGEIELALKDAPDGFQLDGARIPAGRDRVRMTLTAPGEPLGRPVALQLEGRARIDGETVSRPAVPSEDVMQAFLWRHLVPSQEFLVAVQGGRFRVPPLELAGGVPVRIPAGGTAQVRVKAPRGPMLQNAELVLSDPPEGIILQDVKVVPGGLALVLRAEGEAAQAGFADNLIVEAFTETTGGRQGGKAAAQKRRVSLGVLPAIPFEIVQR